ncbi:tyrosine-type recombinase/integrase [Mesorhizobium sp. ASY16-5R]|uniref:tyrosine-type recombinase/integrase n=1 Tax=Mesorhizobium sp. ASY16-5R TaxID=3445772 RepID=UPI003FA0DA9D
MASVLTSRSVEGAKPANSRREIPDGALPGMYLVVQPSGAKSWALRYRVGGKPKKLTIGPTLLKRDGPEVDEVLPLGQAMTLAEARRAARAALQNVAEGTDPSEAKKAIKAAPVLQAEADRDTVEKLGERFVDRYCKPRNRSWKEVDRQFRSEINPVMGTRRVQDVAKRDVLDLLDAIVDRGSPVTANRVLATLKTFFRWLEDRDVVASSPAEKVKKPSAESSRERVLTDAEIKLFWKATAGFEYPFGPMWRFLLLTGQRRNEVAGMMRAELDLDENNPCWTIPANRTKNGLKHVVPLGPACVDILAALPRIGKKGFAFTTTGETAVSGFSRSKARLDAVMLGLLKKQAAEAGGNPEEVALAQWGLHDLRRTMVTRMAALGVGLPVIERCVNHTSGSFAGIVGVYQLHEFIAERRQAFTTWANFIDALVSGESTASNVVMLREAVA